MKGKRSTEWIQLLNKKMFILKAWPCPLITSGWGSCWFSCWRWLAVPLQICDVHLSLHNTELKPSQRKNSGQRGICPENSPTVLVLWPPAWRTATNQRTQVLVTWGGPACGNWHSCTRVTLGCLSQTPVKKNYKERGKHCSGIIKRQ